MDETIEAWNVFTMSNNGVNHTFNDLHTYLVESEKGRSFIYFYEMYVLLSKEILSQLIYFLGINQYWTQRMMY